MRLNLLNVNQILGDEQLEIFKKRGIFASVTDYYLLSGGKINNTQKEYLENGMGYYWTKTPYIKDSFYIVNNQGKADYQFVYHSDVGIRLVTNFDNIKNSDNFIYNKAEDGVVEIEYGFYPDCAADESLQKKLEVAYLNNKLLSTGNSYTKNFVDFNFLIPNRYKEYELDGRRYLRVLSNICKKKMILSNSQTYYRNEGVWVEVKPIKWWVDSETGIMVTEKIITSGIRFNKAMDRIIGYEESELKTFLDEVLSNEIIQKNNFNKEDEKTLCKKKI